jgi:ribosome recycling factor
MSAIDNEILAMFNALNPTRQGQLLDVLGRLTEEQRAERHKEQTANKPANP